MAKMLEWKRRGPYFLVVFKEGDRGVVGLSVADFPSGKGLRRLPAKGFAPEPGEVWECEVLREAEHYQIVRSVSGPYDYVVRRTIPLRSDEVWLAYEVKKLEKEIERKVSFIRRGRVKGQDWYYLFLE